MESALTKNSKTKCEFFHKGSHDFVFCHASQTRKKEALLLSTTSITPCH